MVMVAAAAAVRFPIHHFVDTFVQSLFQVGNGGLKLAGCQALIAGRAGRIGFFEPAQRLVNRCAAIGAVEDQHFFCEHVTFLLDAYSVMEAL